MLITDEYRKLNSELHKSNPNFGSKGWQKADVVYNDFIKKYDVESLLDYGCGKGTLSLVLADKYKVFVENYDPCCKPFLNRPTKTFDGVICNDVLEHVEPELIDNVLQDIYSLGERVFHFEIGLTKSNKVLADGRNNHLIVQPSSWWKETLERNKYKIVDVLDDFVRTDVLIGYYRVVCFK